MDYKSGETVVYPNHGVAVVESIEHLHFGAAEESCYKLRIIANDAVVIVPLSNATNVGLRPTIGKRDVTRVLSRLRDGAVGEASRDWRGRFKENSDRLRSGELLEVADVLRTLSRLQVSRTLSYRERRMLDKARGLVVGELAEVQRASLDETSSQVDNALSPSSVAES